MTEKEMYAVRIDEALLRALRGRAERDHSTVSDLLRRGAERLLRDLEAGGGVELILEEDWRSHARLSAQFARALEDLALDEAEASLICDALNGIITDPAIDPSWTPGSAASHLYAEVADAMRLDDLDRKWLAPAEDTVARAVERAGRRAKAARGEDIAESMTPAGCALLARLRALTPIQACAIVDAVARFWRAPQVGTRALLEAVGLVRADARLRGE